MQSVLEIETDTFKAVIKEFIFNAGVIHKEIFALTTLLLSNPKATKEFQLIASSLTVCLVDTITLT